MDMVYYNDDEVDVLVNETRSVSKDPYRLFAAMVLHSVFDELFDSEDEEVPFGEMWGKSIQQKSFNEILNDCIEDFMAAIDGKLTIVVDGESFSIRNSRNVSEEQLRTMFQFRGVNGEVVISRKLIRNPSVEPKPSFADRLEHGRDNKSYFKKIVYLACNGKYDFLTDMEAAAYCFALHYAKNPTNNVDKRYFLEWHEKWEEYFCLPKDDVLSCLEDEVRYPQYYFSFAARKIREYNHDTGEKSAVDSVDEGVADGYWFDVASKGKFKL